MKNNKKISLKNGEKKLKKEELEYFRNKQIKQVRLAGSQEIKGSLLKQKILLILKIIFKSFSLKDKIREKLSKIPGEQPTKKIKSEQIQEVKLYENKKIFFF